MEEEETLQLEALFDAVIIEPLEEEETEYGSIIVPDITEDVNKKGTVVAVGDGKYSVTGVFIETKLKVGDKVILPSSGFTKIFYKGKEYWIGNETMIGVKIKN
jgi:chaperonin GroES